MANQHDERDEYGIGRVPADVDPTSEALAQVEAAQTMAQMRPPLHATDAEIACPNCGAPTLRSLLMWASIGQACPLCYDDAEN